MEEKQDLEEKQELELGVGGEAGVGGVGGKERQLSIFCSFSKGTEKAFKYYVAVWDCASIVISIRTDVR